jgi:hypothetical protein
MVVQAESHPRWITLVLPIGWLVRPDFVDQQVAQEAKCRRRKSLLSGCSVGREKRPRMNYFGTRCVEAVVCHFKQHCVVLVGSCLVACGFGGHAGVVETIEAAG